MKTGVIPSILLCIVCLFPTCVFGFCFEEAGNRYGINPELLKTIAKTESNLNQKALNQNRNGTLDIGLMQINTTWLKTAEVNFDNLVEDACYNVMTGARILRQCMDRYGYNWEAIGCYNAAAKNKRIEYAWRIFHELKDRPFGQTANKAVANYESSPDVLKQNINTSTLLFCVRDISETRRGIR